MSYCVYHKSYGCNCINTIIGTKPNFITYDDMTHIKRQYPNNYASTVSCMLCGEGVPDFECHFLFKHIKPETIKHYAHYFGLKIEERQSVSIKAAIEKLNADVSTETELLDALSSLKNAGWRMISSPAIAVDDRKGFQITILEPKGT